MYTGNFSFEIKFSNKNFGCTFGLPISKVLYEFHGRVLESI